MVDLGTRARDHWTLRGRTREWGGSGTAELRGEAEEKGVWEQTGAVLGVAWAVWVKLVQGD
eukprot:1546239-Rhodomonas_salina.1